MKKEQVKMRIGNRWWKNKLSGGENTRRLKMRIEYQVKGKMTSRIIKGQRTDAKSEWKEESAG